jgi:hypothetical protein
MTQIADKVRVSFKPHPVAGCDDCAFLTKVNEFPSVCVECADLKMKRFLAVKLLEERTGV